jgi:hypothetical protein
VAATLLACTIAAGAPAWANPNSRRLTTGFQVEKLFDGSKVTTGLGALFPLGDKANLSTGVNTQIESSGNGGDKYTVTPSVGANIGLSDRVTLSPSLAAPIITQGGATAYGVVPGLSATIDVGKGATLTPNVSAPVIFPPNGSPQVLPSFGATFTKPF